MLYQDQTSTGTSVFTMGRGPGTPISFSAVYTQGRSTGKLSPPLLYTGTTDMKKILLLLLVASSAMASTNDPVNQAVAFNKWYVNQINNNNFPITDGKDIDKYVTASTMKKLRRTQDPNYEDEVFYNADFFSRHNTLAMTVPTMSTPLQVIRIRFALMFT